MIQNYIDTHKEIIFKGTLEEQKVILPLFLEKIVVYDKISDLKFIVDLNGGGGAYTFKSTIDISDIRGSIVHVNTGSVLGIMSIKNLKTK
jgi:hypothetical protein